MSLQANVARPLYRALLSAAQALDGELARCQSLRGHEHDSLRGAAATALPRDLRGLLDVAGGELAGSREDEGQLADGPLKSYVRLCARRMSEAAEAPGLAGLDARVGFAAVRHLNARVDALRHLVYDTASEAERFGIRVGVESKFQGADRNRYFFRYRVRIMNASALTVKLLSRAWTIRDLDGRVTSVEGPGVVGAFPTLAPNESYEYSSAVPLHTPVGTQSGHYMFVTLEHSDFPSEHVSATTAAKMLQVPVAPFSYRTPSMKAGSSDDVSSLPSSASSAMKPTRRKKRSDEGRRW